MEKKANNGQSTQYSISNNDNIRITRGARNNSVCWPIAEMCQTRRREGKKMEQLLNNATFGDGGYVF